MGPALFRWQQPCRMPRVANAVVPAPSRIHHMRSDLPPPVVERRYTL
jgi:hypothetical protein